MKNLLVGDNAFIGVSHLSQTRARSKAEQLDINGIVEVVCTSLQNGATGFTFSTHPTNLNVLRSMSQRGCSNFELYPVLPYAQAYVRTANEKGSVKLVAELLSRLSFSGKVKGVLQSGFSAATLDPIRILKAYIDIELGAYARAKPKAAGFGAILLHDAVTDLGTAFETVALFEAFLDHIRTKYETKPGFVTRNLVKFVGFFERNGLSLQDIVIMSPFNKAGFQMTPTKQSCEACLSRINLGEVFAISIFAGGYLSLNEAVGYIKSLPNMSGVVAGVSTNEHAKETFTSLSSLFSPG